MSDGQNISLECVQMVLKPLLNAQIDDPERSHQVSQKAIFVKNVPDGPKPHVGVLC